MFEKKLEVGIVAFLVVALMGAAIASTTVLKTQQVNAQSPKELESKIMSMSKMGVMITSTPVMCTSLGDLVGAISTMTKGIVANMTNNMNLSNATDGLMSLMKNANQTNATQGNLMSLIEKGMSSGMENISTSKLEKLKDFMICSQVDQETLEKTVKEMMK